MPQLRKEQVKVLTARFTQLTGTDALGLAQNKTVDVFTTSAFTAFTNSTITQVLGGAEISCPAFLQNNKAGPYGATSGTQFSITIPGVNSGAAVNVAFIDGDIVTLGGLSVLTTSHAVDRINTVMLAAGVSYPVAQNVNGFLRLTSAVGSNAIVGDSASITIKDVTAGALTSLGFGVTSLVTATGTTGPKRGIVNLAPDGFGGYIPLRFVDGSPATTQVRAKLNIGAKLSVPDIEVGNKIYARLTWQPAASPPSVTLNYKYTGTQQANVITHSGNLTALGIGDSIAVTFTDPVLPTNTLSISLSTPPTLASDVVNTINTAWHVYTEALGGAGAFGAGRAVVTMKGAGPWNFSVSSPETFIVTINGGAPLTISLTGLLTLSQVQTAMNSVFAGAAIATTTTDSVGNTIFAIQTALTNFTGSILVAPGTGNDMRALEKLGIAPGLYKSGPIAKLYGVDEIQIFNPSFNSGSTIAITGPNITFQRLGIPGVSINATTTVAESSVQFPNSVAQILVPEVMEFGEVPSAYEDALQHFLAPARPPIPTSSAGVSNAGLTAMLGSDGKFDSGLLPRIFEYLGIDKLQIGSHLTGSQTDMASARVEASFNSLSGSYTLLLDLPDSSGTLARIRLYQLSTGSQQSLVITHNAGLVAPSATNWAKDNAGNDASYTQFQQGRIINKFVRAADSGTFVDSAWVTSTGLDPFGFAGTLGSFLTLGTGTSSEVTRGDNLIPRLNTPSVGDGTSLTLVWQSIASSLPGYRLYVQSASPNGPMTLTVNANWTGTAWAKDLSGASSTAYIMDGENTYLTYRLAANNATWTTSTLSVPNPTGGSPIVVKTWDTSPFFFSGTASTLVLPGSAVLGAQTALTNAGRAIPRIVVGHDVSASVLRTCIAKFPGGNGANTYFYRGVGFTGANSEGPGAGADCFMMSQNCFWDGTQWNKEQTYNNAMLFIWQGSTRTSWFKGGNAQLVWADNLWNLTEENSRDGLRLPYEEVDPLGTRPIRNLITGNNTPKAWGSVSFARGLDTILTVQIHDSWNVTPTTSLSVDGKTAYVNLYNAFANTDFTVIASSFIEGGGGSRTPGSDTVSGTPSTTSQIQFSAFPAGSTTAKNMNSGGITTQFQFVAFGRH